MPNDRIATRNHTWAMADLRLLKVVLPAPSASAQDAKTKEQR